MSDEKDLEIARLQGRLDGMAVARQRGFSPGRFLAWLVLIALIVVVGLAVIGVAVRPTPEERADAIMAKCREQTSALPDDIYNACVFHEMAKDARRYD